LFIDNFVRPLLVVAELAEGDNINAFNIESFFGNKHYTIKMPRQDRTEKKKQVELNEAATGTKIIKKFFSRPYCSKYGVGAELAAI